MPWWASVEAVDATAELTPGLRVMWATTSLDQARDGLERTIGLQGRKEHLVHALIIRWTIRELDAVEVEDAAIGNCVQQRLASWLARPALERLHDLAACETSPPDAKSSFG